MSSAAIYPHITIETDGVPHIENTRYKVSHLAGEHYHHGWSAEELLRQHPDLRPEHVYSALTYFYDHYDQILGELEAGARTVDDLRQNQTLSRDELLKRASAGSP